MYVCMHSESYHFPNHYQQQNDMIGPNGYGGAHFIPPDLTLEYTIRFENDPNATAPAQKVLIRHHLDEDLDIRTFRIGSFGFGDFTSNVTQGMAFLQVGHSVYTYWSYNDVNTSNIFQLGHS